MWARNGMTSGIESRALKISENVFLTNHSEEKQRKAIIEGRTSPSGLWEEKRVLGRLGGLNVRKQMATTLEWACVRFLSISICLICIQTGFLSNLKEAVQLTKMDRLLLFILLSISGMRLKNRAEKIWKMKGKIQKEDLIFWSNVSLIWLILQGFFQQDGATYYRLRTAAQFFLQLTIIVRFRI